MGQVTAALTVAGIALAALSLPAEHWRYPRTATACVVAGGAMVTLSFLLVTVAHPQAVAAVVLCLLGAAICVASVIVAVTALRNR